MKEIFSELADNVSVIFNGYSTFGIITEVIDILLAVALIIFVLKILKLKFKTYKLIIFLLCVLLLFAIAYLLSLDILLAILKYLGFWLAGIVIIVYSQEMRHIFDMTLHENVRANAFDNEEEKNKIIHTLTETCDYLSKRRIGALITIEGNDNLDSIIDKSISINSDINQEILETMFYPGTVTHDGAVIIRQNTIKCAGAYLPATDRYDIPKELGTRHRAAIGLSEKYDALTIVVSEETGGISITLNGGIQRDLDKRKLTEALNNYYITK